MRARLLDMGEVSAARSQSIYHAVAETMATGDSPVAILLKPVSGLVSIGVDADPAAEIDLELCLENRIPVLRRLLGGSAHLIGENRLLFDFLIPTSQAADFRPPTPAPLAEACRTLGLPSALGPSGEILIGDDDPTRQVGTSQTGTVKAAFCLISSLARDPEPPERRSLLLPDRGFSNNGYAPSSLTQELEDRPDFASVAEVLVEAIEESFDVELVPSMPTPAEMDAIYEWDERLVVDLELAAGTAAAPAEPLVC